MPSLVNKPPITRFRTNKHNVVLDVWI